MARFLATFYLQGGNEITIEVSKLDTVRNDEGDIVGYDIESVPDENLTLFYLKPSQIAGIKAILLEADEVQS